MTLTILGNGSISSSEDLLKPLSVVDRSCAISTNPTGTPTDAHLEPVTKPVSDEKPGPVNTGRFSVPIRKMHRSLPFVRSAQNQLSHSSRVRILRLLRIGRWRRLVAPLFRTPTDRLSCVERYLQFLASTDAEKHRGDVSDF